MREEVAKRIAESARTAGLPMPALPPPAPSPGRQSGAQQPSPDAAEAMANLPPEQRDQVIRGMVEKLAAQVKANPDDADGWVRLGRSYGVLGDADKSADAFDHAAKLKPDDVSIPLQEARAILETRKPEAPVPEKVVALLHKVEAVQPDEPEVLWYLGAAAAQEDRKDEAERYWQRLLPLLPADGDDHKMVQQALDSLKGR
jgi:cytochrome c-type biogenesis protein CcmH